MLWKCCTPFSFVTQYCPNLWDSMDCSMLSLPVHHQLPKFNSCPLNQWSHPTISSYVVPFSTRLQSFPASGSFQMSPFFSSGDQSIGVSASASVLPVNIRTDFLYDWLVGSPCSLQGALKSLLQHQSSKASVLWPSAFFMVQLSHPYVTTGKAIALTRRTFVSKVVSWLLQILPLWTLGCMYFFRLEFFSGYVPRSGIAGSYSNSCF